MGDILMSEKEIHRHEIFKKVAEKRLKLSKAANLFGISYRHTKRLWSRYKAQGKQGLISQKRGKSSNRKMPKDVEEKILEFINEPDHRDYGPTYASEKLQEKCGIIVSKEKVRQLLIQEGLHRPRKRKPVRLYQRRTPRPCNGELSQIDGSPHDWFEGRGPKCTLLISVDDATSKIKTGRFEPEETTAGYFRLEKSYIELYGLPLGLYSDRYGVFRVNQGTDRSKKTQFARAMKELDIELICAYSPQAKGRIERIFGVLQDRLVKEMRDKNISTIEEANKFLSEYFEDYNRRFGHAPANSFDAHRPLSPSINLNHILCHKETRKVSKQLEIQYKNRILQLQAPGRERSLQGKRVVVLETLEGEILIEFKGKLLDYNEYERCEAQPPVVDHKQLAAEWEKRCRRKRGFSRRSHPWHQWRPNAFK